MKTKQDYFKTFLLLLNHSYQDVAKEYAGERAYPKLTFVEVMKFLFFTCVLEKKLLETFDEWVALPKGPVEDDSYAFLKSNKDFMAECHEKGRQDELESMEEDEVIALIKEAISKLKEGELLRKKESYLVELSHKWEAWRKPFLHALNQGRRASSMNTNEIKNERCYI